MDFHRLLQVASERQTDLEQQKKLKPEKKPAQPAKLRKNREKGVISANVKAFMERKEKEEKKKEEDERRKKEELLKKRDEVRHAKTAKAMASRTKDNLQFYTKEKLDNFVAKEKEREEKLREKEERKYQKLVDKQRLREEGKTRRRRTKYEIARDSGKNLEPPKQTVGVKVETKKKKTSRSSKPQGKPPLDFNALIQMAQAKQTNTEQPNQKNGKAEKGDTKGPGRPMTKEERERWERTHTREYQNFLKNGGKRPEYAGVKQLKESANGSSSRECSPVPKISSKSANTSNEDFKKQTSKRSIQQNGPSKRCDSKAITSSDNNSMVKKTYLKGDIRAGPSNTYERSKPTKKEQSTSRDIPSSPESEVNETVIQCGPTKSKPALKRKPEEPKLNPFDRIIQRYDAYRPPEKKHRQVIESDSEEEYDSEMDDFIDDGDEGNDYSSAIKEIFGYDKKKYRYEEEDVSDMETNYASIMREEARSAKIGLREDLEDIKREEEENRRKEEKRKMRAKELKKMKQKGR